MGRHTPATWHGAGWFTRLRAILAGALVLGVGATLTLAAWTDDEYASGTFAASTFVVESQTAAAPWTAHEAANPATMQFSAGAMSPGMSTYAYIDIRTTLNSTVDGTVSLSAITTTSGELLPHLQYRAMVTTPTTSCASAGYPAAYTSVVEGPTPLLSGNLGAASAAPQRFCFEVRLASGTPTEMQGKIASATWQFTAISSS